MKGLNQSYLVHSINKRTISRLHQTVHDIKVPIIKPAKETV